MRDAKNEGEAVREERKMALRAYHKVHIEMDFTYFIIARSAYYFRTGPFEKISLLVCLSVRIFRDFTEGEIGFAQGPI